MLSNTITGLPFIRRRKAALNPDERGKETNKQICHVQRKGKREPKP